MMGLPHGAESMMTSSAALIQYRTVTDGQTDIIPIPISRVSIAVLMHGKSRSDYPKRDG